METHGYESVLLATLHLELDFIPVVTHHTLGDFFERQIKYFLIFVFGGPVICRDVVVDFESCEKLN